MPWGVCLEITSEDVTMKSRRSWATYNQSFQAWHTIPLAEPDGLDLEWRIHCQLKFQQIYHETRRHAPLTSWYLVQILTPDPRHRQAKMDQWAAFGSIFRGWDRFINPTSKKERNLDLIRPLSGWLLTLSRILQYNVGDTLWKWNFHQRLRPRDATSEKLAGPLYGILPLIRFDSYKAQ